MTNEFAGTGNGELLKSLVSISDAINEQIFNANQTIDGSFINRQAIIADIDPIENLKLQMEEREKDEDAKDNLVSAGEQLENAREEQERARQEAWKNEPSTDYPGLTNGQVLSGLRTICANLPYYTNMAVQRGWIKAEEEPEFADYLRRERWLKEQELLGNTNSPEYIDAKRKQDQVNQNHPRWHDLTVTLDKEANGLNADINQDQTHGQATAARVDSAAINARFDLFNSAGSTADTLQANADNHRGDVFIRADHDRYLKEHEDEIRARALAARTPQESTLNAYVHGADVNIIGLNPISEPKDMAENNRFRAAEAELVRENIDAGGILTHVNMGADFKVAVAGNGTLSANAEIANVLTPESNGAIPPKIARQEVGML